MLEAESENFLHFGYSITSADFDHNGYSDIAVGALKGGVKIFRSKPIIDLHAELSMKLNGNKMSEIKLEAGKNDKVQIQFCFGFSERSKMAEDKIKV